MGHILTALKHSSYVYVIAFLGALGIDQTTLTNLSTAHGAEIALGPAALGAAVSVVRTASPALLQALAAAITANAPAPKSALAPDATDAA